MDNFKFELFAKLVNNLNIRILEHGFYKGGIEWRYFNLSSPFNRLYFMIDGEGRVETKDGTVKLLPGRMYIIPPNVRFNIVCDNYIEKFYLHFSAELFSGNDVFDGVGHCVWRPMEDAWLRTLIANAKSSSPADIAKSKSMIFSVVADFMKQLSLGFDQEFAINHKYGLVHEFIRNNLSASITSKNVAEALNLSYSSLIKRYRKDTGMTLNAYIKNALLKKAIEKLLFTDMSIKEIAYELRFTDEFYFSRFFKKQTGQSPKEYKMANSPSI